MVKYISCEELDNFFDREIRLYEPCPDKYDATVELKSASHFIPAADVQPVVLAYWKSVPHKRARVCSRCEADEPYKFADDDANVYNFCPNCGAKMEEN